MGGAGSAVLEALAAARHRRCRCCTLGLPDKFIEHGDPAKLLAHVRARCRRHRAVDAQALRRCAPALVRAAANQ